MSEDRELEILLDELPVGRLQYRNDGSTFRLLDSYRSMPNRPILGQIFEDDPERVDHVRSGVPPWFANLLPEGPLRQLIADEAGVHVDRSFFLLEHLGEDLPGAVRAVRVPFGSFHSSPDSSLESDTKREATELTESFAYKFSLAGVQLKFSVLKDDRGITVPVHGELGDFIVKLPDDRFDSVPENEFAMMSWASTAGIDVPEIDLIPTDSIEGLPPELSIPGSKSFIVRRFDRVGGRRIHIEDLAQVLNRPPTTEGKYSGANYETVGRIILATSGLDDLHEFVRRLVAMVLMGNGDAHLKNFSLIYPDGRHARLSPAYDLVSTFSYVRVEETLALNLAKSKSFEAVTAGSFRRMARKLELPSEFDLDAVVQETVQRLMSSWPQIRSDSVLDPHLRDSIDRRLASLPLLESP